MIDTLDAVVEVLASSRLAKKGRKEIYQDCLAVVERDGYLLARAWYDTGDRKHYGDGPRGGDWKRLTAMGNIGLRLTMAIESEGLPTAVTNTGIRTVQEWKTADRRKTGEDLRELLNLYRSVV